MDTSKKAQQLPLIFEEHMPRLKGLMQVPKGDPIHVVIVDDNEHAVIGMRTMLGNWNNMALTTIIQSGGKMPRIEDGNHIILLDEEMAGLTGSQVADWMVVHGFTGIIASTSFMGGDERPRYKFHFNNKVGVGTSVDAAVDFIKFMNRLIEEISRDRMD